MAVASYKDTMDRMLTNPMRKTFTFLGVTLLIVIVFLMGAIRPTITTISRLRREIDVRTEVDADLQTKINNLQTLRAEYESKKESLSAIDTFFPADSDYSLVMASLEQVTAKYGYTMDSLHISADKNSAKKSDYQSMEMVTIRLSAQGRKSNIVKLLQHIEHLPIIPSIRRITFSPAESNQDPSWIRVSVDMYAYKTAPEN